MSERNLYRIPVEWTDPFGNSGHEYQYVYADDPDGAARKAEANVEKESEPGTDVFADADRARLAKVINGQVVVQRHAAQSDTEGDTDD